jgi:hypothetical protein
MDNDTHLTPSKEDLAMATLQKYGIKCPRNIVDAHISKPNIRIYKCGICGKIEHENMFGQHIWVRGSIVMIWSQLPGELREKHTFEFCTTCWGK